MKSINVSRKKDIDLLFEIINQRDFYKENSENGFVVLLNGSWGSGKTTFLKELECEIKKREEYDLFVNYNSYSYDFYDNAYLPFFASIEDKVKLGDDFGKFIKSTSKTAFNGLVSLSYSVINKSFKTKTGIDLNEIKDNLLGIENENYLKAFNDFKECKEKIEKKLKNYCEKIPKIIIIDELDRCKPDFALETLEIVKHFFDIENCIFVIAVDKLQLHESAKTIFGQGMDVEKYFSKFFDYQYNLLPLNFNEIIDTSDINDLEEIINRASDVFNYLKVSSRDSKKIFCDFVSKYRKYSKGENLWTSDQSIFIIFLLTLKYVDLLFYSEIMNGNFSKFEKKVTNEINPMSNNYSKLLKIAIGSNKDFSHVCETLSEELNTIFISKEKIYTEYILKDNKIEHQKYVAKNLMLYIPRVGSDITYKETIEKIIN